MLVCTANELLFPCAASNSFTSNKMNTDTSFFMIVDSWLYNIVPDNSAHFKNLTHLFPNPSFINSINFYFHCQGRYLFDHIFKLVDGIKLHIRMKAVFKIAPGNRKTLQLT